MKKLFWIDRLEYMEGRHLYIITFFEKEHIFTFQLTNMKNDYLRVLGNYMILAVAIVALILITVSVWLAN